MYSKYYIKIVLIFIFASAKGQVDPNTLLALPSLPTVDIVATTTATEGSLVFDSDQKKVFEFNGTVWKELLTAPPTVSPKTGDYTLTAADNYSILTFDSATDITLTIPAGLDIGFNISIYQIGAGKVTITGSGGISLKNRLSRFRTAGLDAGVGIVCTASNIFHITGDLKK